MRSALLISATAALLLQKGAIKSPCLALLKHTPIKTLQSEVLCVSRHMCRNGRRIKRMSTNSYSRRICSNSSTLALQSTSLLRSGLRPMADGERHGFAHFEASSFSRCEITVGHLPFGVLREDPSLVSGVALEAVVRTIEASKPAGRRVPPMEDLRLSDEANRVKISW